MRIVMDDAGDIPPELADQYNIVTIPVNVTFGTEQYLTGVELDHAGFYEKVKEVGDHNFPKSSQPTPFQYVELYKSLMAEGEDEFMTITVGEKLSGTYASAEAARAQLQGQADVAATDLLVGGIPFQSEVVVA